MLVDEPRDVIESMNLALTAAYRDNKLRQVFYLDRVVQGVALRNGWVTSGRGGGEVLVEELMALAALAGNTVVAAATTDVWDAAKRRFVRLLGRGDPNRTQAAERRLEVTHQQLTVASGADLESVRSALEARWVNRLADLLEEDPSIEADLRAVVGEIRAQLPAGVVAADHSFAAGGPVTFTASDSAVAAGVIHGGVTTGNPPRPDLESRQPDPG